MEALRFVRAKAEDFEAVRRFYYELIDAMEGSEYRPMWQKGVYPSDEFLAESAADGTLFLALAGEEIVGTMVMNRLTNDGYAGTDWPTEAGEGEVSVLHALGVKPAAARQGVGSFLVENAVRLAREQGQKAIRLDVLKGNLPADRLYRRAGFTLVRTANMYYEDTGWTDFDLYEKAL